MRKINFKKRFILSLACFLIGATCALAQKMTVNGIVTDEQEEVLAGVNITVKGTNTGTITDSEGKFTIAADQDDVLEFSYVGFHIASHKATVNMAVKMQKDLHNLDEVVVVGYGVQKKSDLTGAISSVKKEDIQNRSLSRAEEALQGKAAGVQLLSPSGQPGASPEIRIRGFSSNGSSSPLYVVDGLIRDDLSAVDPSNIESIEILKDAASASIYGAQAGNGVVLVTTKSGKNSKTAINYDFQYRLTDLARKPKLMSTDDQQAMNIALDPAWSDADLQVMITDGLWDGESSTDWYDAIFSASPTTHNALNFTGSNERGNYFLSLSKLHENGIIRGDVDVYNRLSVVFNGDYKIKPWLTTAVTSNYFKWDSKGVDDSSNGSVIKKTIGMNPYFSPVYSPDALPTTMQNLLTSGFTLLQDEHDNYYVPGNPMIDIYNHDAITSGRTLEGTLTGYITPMKGLLYTTRLAYRDFSFDHYNHRKFYYNDPGSFNTEFNGVDRAHASQFFYQWENFANYWLTLAEHHNISLMAGMSYSETKFLDMSAGVDKIAENDPLFADVAFPAADAIRSGSGLGRTARSIAYFGRAEYNYKGRYLLQGSLRTDAADLSILPKGNRWGTFPSVSAGWVLSEEPFYQKSDNNPVEFLKIRASWGQNGSIRNLGGYAYNNSLANNTVGYSFSTANNTYTPAVYPNQLFNPNLKWETSEQIDVGIDLRAFKNRLSFATDWYSKKTKDLIVGGIVIPFAAGNNAAPMNVGNISNRGLEFEVNWNDQIGNFRYTVAANLATLKNKVTYLDPIVSDGRVTGNTLLFGSSVGYTAFEEGYPIWYFRGYEVDHIDPENGNPYYKTADGGTTLNPSENDKRSLGKPMPDYTYGLTLTAAYKGFDLAVFGQGSQGNSGWMSYSIYTWKDQVNRMWTPENTGGEIARPNTTVNYMMSDHYVFDASYFRIRQIQLGYTLPKYRTQKLFMQNIRLFASLDNFFTFTKYPGLDPEVSVNTTNGMGIDFGKYPTVRKAVFGLSCTF